MTDIAHLLQNVRSGNVTDRQFLGIIHRELRLGGLDSTALISALRDDRQALGLAPSLRRQAVDKIQSWLNRPATGTPTAGEPESWGYDGGDTVVNPEALRQVITPGAARDLSAFDSDAGTARVGRVLNGRFQLIERIGSGGMSSVFKAVDRRRVEAQSPDPYVAVKTLNLAEGDHGPALTLLQREAQKLQSLAHPNIVRVMDCDRDGGLVFMTMEYLSGESLKHRLQSRGQGLERDEAMQMLAGIGAALIHAHQNHLVHGDLKPANVIVTGAGQVKVIDFGVARVIHQAQHRTVDGASGIAEPGVAEPSLAATPRYASPEMLTDAPPDPRDDVYALGCIASELFSGLHPFERLSALEAQATGLRPVQGSGVSNRQYRAIRHALQFDRSQRTSSVERFLIEFGADMTAVGGPSIVVAGARDPVRNLGLIAIAVLLLAGVLTWWLTHRPNTISANTVPASIATAQSNPSAATPSAAAPSATTAPATAAAVDAVFRDCPTCPLMKVLPAGHFQQGSVAGNGEAVALEYPQHNVTIAHPFAMSVNDVTVAEFREYAEATGAEPSGCWTYDGRWREHADLSWRHVGFEQAPAHPVTCISWRDAVAYAEWLSSRTGQQYRLPSASEWEYAAEGGTGEVRPWQSRPELACQSGNVADESAMSVFPGWKTFACRDGYVYTAPVGSFAPNGFGLYDTLGNVFQWMADCWNPGYDHAPADGSAWQSGDCSRHEVRGGSWFTDPAFVRTTYRNRFAADYRTNTVGFRLVRVMP